MCGEEYLIKRINNMGQIKRKLINEQEEERLNLLGDFVKVDTKQKKDSNPKDAVGVKKVPLSTVPAEVLMEIGLGMLEGARKYGRHNYRVVGVRASVYYDAAMRHLMAWWEGEDNDPDSDLNHITKALCTLVVFRDAMLNQKLEDDRPPSLESFWLEEWNQKARNIIEDTPNAKEAYTEKGRGNG